jgi:hypothetical protein
MAELSDQVVEMEKGRIFIAGLLALAFMATGFACADPSIPAIPETQGITTTTSAQVSGWFSMEQETAWQISTSPLGSSLARPSPSFPAGPYVVYMPGNIVLEEILGDGNEDGGILYETVYSESTSATAGTIDYAKIFSADTGNKISGGTNIEAERLITYTADSSGRLASSEYLMLDSAGEFSVANEVFTCPFAAQVSEIVPQFCNRVEMGSDLDISTGSVSTDASDRFVQATGDYPVASDYSIRLTGAGDEFAQGSVSAFVNVLDQEGNVDIIARIPFEDPEMGILYLLEMGLGSELCYEELSEVHGQIAVFDKDMHYESGVLR